MTLLQILGALMIAAILAAPFIYLGVSERSWKPVAVMFGIFVVLLGFIALASALLTGAIA